MLWGGYAGGMSVKRAKAYEEGFRGRGAVLGAIGIHMCSDRFNEMVSTT